MIQLIDGSNIVNICYFSFVKFLENKEGKGYIPKKTDIGFFIHLFFQKIKSFYEVCLTNVFCLEGTSSTAWRKSIYPEYKENRHKEKNEQYDLIGEAYSVSQELLQYLPGCVLAVENCEADDLIYALSKYFSFKNENIKILSTDRDLLQILNFYPQVSFFDIVKNEFKQKDKDILQKKAICGDSSDNIKGVKGIGPKTLEKMLSDNKVWSEMMTKYNGQEEYLKCMKIVDLRECPYTKQAIKGFLDKGWNGLDKQGLLEFFDKYNLTTCKTVFLDEVLPALVSMNQTKNFL